MEKVIVNVREGLEEKLKFLRLLHEISMEKAMSETSESLTDFFLKQAQRLDKDIIGILNQLASLPVVTNKSKAKSLKQKSKRR